MALRINAKLGQHARTMRHEPTDHERRLWAHLRASQLDGSKFRRQPAVEPYISDFLRQLIGLIMEVDDDRPLPERNRPRDFDLAHLGYSVLRFANAAIRDNLDGVLTTILAMARSLPERRRITQPNPSPQREGL
ncbi:DUF559 domain-containing protein [Sphingobium sp. Sx8-8]|uniref:endonuclease domain-containing protein n=1 Tax=Sphingobium sp. Sx8-8 TaxID=2933617 RepID=UPI001F5A6E23|nr:DUF559 domain-containing protein [Sphingobium sp. Sx8-8]